MSDEQLKSCPFCGSEASYKEESDPHGGYFTLGCSDRECAAFRAYYAQPIEDKYGCIAVWNRRQPAAPDLLEALQALLDECGEGIATSPLTREKARAAIQRATKET